MSSDDSVSKYLSLSIRRVYIIHFWKQRTLVVLEIDTDEMLNSRDICGRRRTPRTERGCSKSRQVERSKRIQTIAQALSDHPLQSPLTPLQYRHNGRRLESRWSQVRIPANPTTAPSSETTEPAQQDQKTDCWIRLTATTVTWPSPPVSSAARSRRTRDCSPSAEERWT